MYTKFLSFVVQWVQFTAAIRVETTHYNIHQTVYKSMPVLETISDKHAHRTCITKCAHLEQCYGSKLEEMSNVATSSCKLIGYKTLDAANQQIDIHNAFFKSDFELCPDGFIQIMNSCYQFITDDNNHDGKFQCHFHSIFNLQSRHKRVHTF